MASPEGGVSAPIALQKRAPQSHFPTPLSVKGLWMNGAAPEGAHYHTKAMRIPTD
jgi:hypothetical protein